MKEKNKLFDMSPEQKKMMSDISTLCGVKQETIMLVWQYTFFANYLKLLEDKDKSFSRIQLPMFGSILAKHNTEGDLDLFVMLNDEIKSLMSRIKKGQSNEIVDYFKEKFVDTITTEIDNE